METLKSASGFEQKQHLGIGRRMDPPPPTPGTDPHASLGALLGCSVP